MNDILNYKDFEAFVHFNPWSQIFYGKVLGIEKLICFEGRNVKELNRAFQKSVDDYLQTKELENTLTFPAIELSGVLLPIEVHEKVLHYTQHKNVSIQDFVVNAICSAMRDHNFN